MTSLTDSEDAKDYAIEVCKSPLAMNVMEIDRSIRRFGFVVGNYGSVPNDAPKPQSCFVCLRGGMREERYNRERIFLWLLSLSEFPWLGQWTFPVVRTTDANWDIVFSIEVFKSRSGGWSVSGLSRFQLAQLTWPKPLNE